MAGESGGTRVRKQPVPGPGVAGNPWPLSHPSFPRGAQGSAYQRGVGSQAAGAKQTCGHRDTVGEAGCLGHERAGEP